MSHQQQTVSSAPEKTAKCVINPVTTNPEEAAKFVQAVFKHEKISITQVAAAFSPLWGFGPSSNSDPLARGRAECVFVAPESTRPRAEFVRHYVGGRWGLPLAKFAPTLALVREYQFDMAWRGRAYPVLSDSPEEHYARFIIIMITRLEDPYPRTTMLKWLRDARYLRENTYTEDVAWIYFHAIMYLQLKAMEVAKKNATPKERVRHIVNKLKSRNSFSSILTDFTCSKESLDKPEEDKSN
ncbi:hypothetical protein F5Y08DRAFT_337859 [Xylaria arbuscula]|nr:hypothetical protein F5Y08DRAFT_337859 [Xylaria arbuscula]